MQIYPAGTSVTLTAPLVDGGGNPLNAQSVSYSVVDMNENVVVPSTAVSTFSPGSATVTVTVPAAINQVAALPPDSQVNNTMIGMFNTREARTIIFQCVDQDGNQFVVKSSYGLENPDPLHVGMNSFQTLPYAELTAMDIVGTPGWDGASDKDKIAAMIDAWNRITQLNFWLLNSNVNWGQDNMNYVPEGVYQSPYASDGQQMFIFNGNLALLTPIQYQNLPYRFKRCLEKAQVAEADYLLGGDPTDLIRQNGVILDTVGQTKQMYRTTKALDLPVSKRALKYLSQFVTFSKRIGRG